MLLRSSISNTMKLLQKTLENIKSCFSPSYQKLPKTPHHNQFQQSSYKDLELEKFYTDFTKQWDSEKGRKRRSKKKSVMSSPRKLKEEENKGSLINLNDAKNETEIKREECEKQKKNKKSLNYQRGKRQDSSLNSKAMSVVAKKLRELEMLEKNNVDYVLDIEEVLHYYSRLTCPLYLEIVDKFFMEMYSEFFGDSVRS